MAKNFLRWPVFLQPSTQFRGKVPEFYNVYPSVRLPAELQGFPVEVLSNKRRARDQEKTNPKRGQNLQNSSCDKKQNIYYRYCTGASFKNEFFFSCLFLYSGILHTMVPDLHLFLRGEDVQRYPTKKKHPPADDVTTMRHSGQIFYDCMKRNGPNDFTANIQIPIKSAYGARRHAALTSSSKAACSERGVTRQPSKRRNQLHRSNLRNPTPDAWLPRHPRDVSNMVYRGYIRHHSLLPGTSQQNQ